MQTIWMDTIDFEKRGGWQPETQFVREMGQPYLIANEVPGKPAGDAETTFTVEADGWYRVFVRTKNWKYPEAPGQFRIIVDGETLPAVCGKMPVLYWYWDVAGDVYLNKGTHTLALHDVSGWLARCAAVVVTDDMDFLPSPELSRLLRQRAQIKGIDTKPKDMGDWDLVVVGAGPGGMPAAVSAARRGMKVALISGRPTIGGNASEEGTIGFNGAGATNPGWHETGIANEIKRVWEELGCTYQRAMEYLVEREPNITVFLDTMCIDAETENDVITSITCVNTMTLEKSVFRAPFFADCTGDGWVGYYAGAKYRLGREAKHEFNEEFAPDAPDALTMSGCTCAPGLHRRLRCDPKRENPLCSVGQFRNWMAEDTGSPVEFVAPDWAIKLPAELGRVPDYKETTEWWMENSNDFDDLWDSEFARDELVRLGIGYFDWRKNVYEGRAMFENWALTGLALHNSKRENRRLVGDYILTQNDCIAGTHFDDAVTYHGWGIDVHSPKGMYSGADGVFHLDMRIPVSPVPYRCLYSVNVKNLFVASRCSSVTHLALGSTRIENTIASFGQAVGTAAALCRKYGVLPRDIYTDHIRELQQWLVEDDQTIVLDSGTQQCVVNEDERDLARSAQVSASSEDKAAGAYAANVINGELRSYENVCNAWVSSPDETLPQSITLTLAKPATISRVQITTDTDLTLPKYAYWSGPHFAYTARDVDVEVLTDAGWTKVGQVRGNFCRVMRVDFEALCASQVRVTVLASSGADQAKLNEIRIY